MAKTIITQDKNLVNYANVVAVTVEPVSRDNEDYSPDEAYAVVAYDITNETIPLGYYATYEQACDAEMSLVNWLDGEAFGVYRFSGEVT